MLFPRICGRRTKSKIVKRNRRSSILYPDIDNMPNRIYITWINMDPDFINDFMRFSQGIIFGHVCMTSRIRFCARFKLLTLLLPIHTQWWIDIFLWKTYRYSLEVTRTSSGVWGCRHTGIDKKEPHETKKFQCGSYVVKTCVMSFLCFTSFIITWCADVNFTTLCKVAATHTFCGPLKSLRATELTWSLSFDCPHIKHQGVQLPLSKFTLENNITSSMVD